jgi:hypothetical protein
MGSDIDDVFINVGIEGYTFFKIEGSEVVNGRRRITLTITKGKEELYGTPEGKRNATMKWGDQYNLTLSEGHPLVRN